MMREKKRYLLLKIVSEKPLDEKTAKHAIYHAALSFLGELGSSKAKVKLKVFDEKAQTAIVKCTLGEQENVIAALAMLRKYAGMDICLRLEKISGAIGKLE